MEIEKIKFFYVDNEHKNLTYKGVSFDITNNEYNKLMSGIIPPKVLNYYKKMVKQTEKRKL